MYNEVTFDTRNQWEAEIQKTIGSSAVATIMGANPWDTPLQLYGRMRGDLPPREQKLFMRAGHTIEALIAQLYAEETGRIPRDPGEFTIQINPDYPWLHCTVDRLASILHSPQQGDGVLELKNVGWRMRKDWQEGTPIYTTMQIQEQLAVTGLAWGSAAALLDCSEFVYEDHVANEPFIAAMLKKTEEFADRVKRGVPPEATGEDRDTLRLLYADYEKGKTIELPEKALAHDAIRMNAKEDRDRAQKTYEYCSVKIQEMIGDAECGTLPGGGGYTWKRVNKKAYMVKATSYRELRRTNK